VAPKKYIDLRPQPQPKALPVRYPVYHAIAELNRSFEATIESLQHLATFNFFRRENLRAYQAMIEEVRALANDELMDAVHPRELQNARYYERLRLTWETQSRESPHPARLRNTTKARKAARR
jgi:hypothetical protein